MAAKSPVKLVCFHPWKDVGDPMKVCKWKVLTPRPTVKFRARYRKDWYAIMHPSTRDPGKCQVTHFDDDGPIGDVTRKDCETALYDMGIGRDWKLERIAKSGNELQGLRPRRRRKR